MSDPKKRLGDVKVSKPSVNPVKLLTAVRLVVDERPGIQALSHVTTSINTFLFCFDYWTLSGAAQLGSKRLVDRFLLKVVNDPQLSDKEKYELYKHAMGCAAVTGHLPVVQQLYELNPALLNADVGIIAALSGELSLLKWIQQEKSSLFHQRRIWAERVAFDVAAERGSLETVKWLVETFPESTWPMAPAARSGNLELVRWLHAHVHIDELQRNCSVGLLSVLALKMCYQFVKKCKMPTTDAVERSINARTPLITDAMDGAAGKGHLKVLKWLDAHRSEGCSTEAVNSAAEAGHMEVLTWMCDHCNDMWTPAAMDHAAKGGHLEVIKWMDSNRSEGCSTSAMDLASEGCTTLALDWAAECGHLEVVKWLHENRGEGCTTKAMNGAARNGHLDVVKWLHGNRSEGCTTGAMDEAAEWGHLEVVKWLHENRSEGCTTTAVDYAAGGGYLDIIEFLYANRTEGGTAMASLHASDYGRHAVLQWFEEHNVELPIPV